MQRAADAVRESDEADVATDGEDADVVNMPQVNVGGETAIA